MDTRQQYADFFRRQCTGLATEKRAELEKLLVQADPRPLFMFLERLRTSGEVASREFDEALTEFYWRFC
jgi:hypothetical protein